MRHLLYYSATSDYTAEQTAAGGDGSNVVSVVNAVARCMDTRKVYYRESMDPSNMTSYTVTVKYQYTDDIISKTIDIRSADTYTVMAYRGKKTNLMVYPKNVSGYTAKEAGALVEVTGDNTVYVFQYDELPKENVLICYYKKTVDGEQEIFKYADMPNRDSGGLYLTTNGYYYDLNNYVHYSYQYGMFQSQGSQTPYLLNFPGEINSIHRVDYRLRSDEVSGYDAKNLYQEAFCGITSLVKVVMPDVIENIQESAFTYCTALSSMTLSNRLTNFDANIFYRNPWISANTIVLPKTVTTVGSLVNVVGIEIPPQSIVSGNNNLWYYRENGRNSEEKFLKSQLKSITLSYNFLTSLNISNVFWGSNRVSDVHYNGTFKEWCEYGRNFGYKFDDFMITWGLHSEWKLHGDRLYNNTYDTTTEYWYDSHNRRYGGYKLYINNELLTGTVTIPGDVTKVNSGAFCNVCDITGINITNGVKEIGSEAFAGLTTVTSITIPSSVINIGENAFNGITLSRSNFINNSGLDAEAANYWGATITD